MKDILETYRTTELRSIVSEHNKKIRKIVREDLKKIRQNILDKRLINLKGKKRGEIIEIISENKRFFKHVKPKPQQPKREPKFVIEKILQPKINEAYKQYAKDRDLDELEDAVKKIRKTATENGVKTYHTKAKLVSMVKDAVPPVVAGKKTPPPKPGSEPRFFYDPEMKVMRLKSAPIRPSRPPPPRKWDFDFNDIHEMNGKLMTGKAHSAGSRDLTESEIERYDKAKAEKTRRELKDIETEEKGREASKKEQKQKEVLKRLRDPAKREMIFRKADKQKKIFNDLLKKLSKVDLTKREQAYIDDLEDKVSGDGQTEKDLEKIKRLVLKYQEEIDEKEEAPKKKVVKKVIKKKSEEPKEEGLKLVVEEKKPKKAPPKKENKNIIPEFSINKKQEELMLESLPLDEYTKDDQKSLYKEIVEQYVAVKLEQSSELEASQNFDDRDDRKLFEFMLENNLFLSSDPMIKDMKIGLKEKAEFKKDLAARK